MTNFFKTTLIAGAVAIAAGSAQAATINPGDFDDIFTEGQRTQTVDGTDVSGFTVAGFPDVTTFDVGSIDVDDSLLIVGRGVENQLGLNDEFTSDSVSGVFTANIINFAESSRNGVSPFTGLFELFVDGSLVETIQISSSTLVENVAFTSITLNDASVLFRTTVTDGIADYDLSFSSVAAVPLPASLPLALAGLLGLGYVGMRRRKVAA